MDFKTMQTVYDEINKISREHTDGKFNLRDQWGKLISKADPYDVLNELFKRLEDLHTASS
jgi:hypothetical protein